MVNLSVGDRLVSVFVNSTSQVVVVLLSFTVCSHPTQKRIDVPANTRLVKVFDLEEGELDFLSIECLSPIQEGQLFSHCAVIRAGGTDQTINDSAVSVGYVVSGYVCYGRALTFPHTSVKGFTPKEIGYDFVTPVNPAASSYVYTLPAYKNILVKGVTFDYVTNATVAARRLRVTAITTVGGLTVSETIANTTQAASLTYSYRFCVNGRSGFTGVTPFVVTEPLHELVGIYNAVSVRIDALLSNAADRVQNIVFWGEGTVKPF